MTFLRNLCCVLAGMMLSLPCVAQIGIGDALRMNLNGTAGFGYSGNSTEGQSSSGWGAYGNSNLRGSYYSPNFLSFSVSPYYGHGHSDSQGNVSTSNNYGVGSGVTLFGGTHFPLSIGYAKGMNNTGEFNTPGNASNLKTHGDNQNTTIGWSALVPGRPQLFANYDIEHDSSEIYGEQEGSTSTSHTLQLRSNYKWDGFVMNGGYTRRSIDLSLKQFVDGQREPELSNSTGNDFQADVQHPMIMHGTYNVAISHSNYGYAYHDGSSGSGSGGSTSISSGITALPIDKLGFSVHGSYSNSLVGGLPREVTTAGTLKSITSQGTFKSYLLSSDVNYQPINRLTVRGSVSYQLQQYLGRSYSGVQFGGNAAYSASGRFMKALTFSAGLNDSATKEGNTGLGGNANVNFDKRFGQWDVGANYAYAQNVQTLVAVYTTSYMNYSVNLRRRLGMNTYLTTLFSGAHSGITQHGNTSNSERYQASLSRKRYSVSGFYTTSHGAVLYTSNGLVPVPTNLPSSIFNRDEVLSDATAYGFSGGATPIRRLTLSWGYSSSHGSTISPTVTTKTNSQLFNGTARYRLRKLYLDGTYSRMSQGLSSSHNVPVVVTSYSFGITRWFEFF